MSDVILLVIAAFGIAALVWLVTPAGRARIKQAEETALAVRLPPSRFVIITLAVLEFFTPHLALIACIVLAIKIAEAI
jgi:hypothetical protein